MTSEDDASSERKNGALEEDHESLKYQLLGPSLTKAGQDAVDQQKVRWCLTRSSSRRLTRILSLGLSNHIQCIKREQVL